MPICAFDIAPDGTASPLSERPPEGGYRWLHFDLRDPALPDWLAQHVPPIPAAALTAPETRPRCDRYGDGLMLNFRGVNLNSDGPADQMVAVRMWITRHLVVTVRMRRVFAIDAIRQEAEAGTAPETPMDFVTDLVERLMLRARDTVFDLDDRVDAFEETLLENGDTLPESFSGDRRMAIRLRRYLGPQRDALAALEVAESDLIAPGQRDRLREAANLAKLSVEELDAIAGRLTALNDHHAARLAERQNKNAYGLSVVAAIFLPLGFLTGLFGVNVGGMPGLDSPLAFAVLCAGLLVLTGLSVVLLRWLRWI